MPARTLFLIDGSNQMYRAYHAIRGLTGPDGKSTNAVYGFVTMLRKLIADHQPAYIAASFDLGAQTFRSKLAADYKANRSAMPDDLREQIAWVHEACEAMGVPILTSQRYEADDVIGTLATKAIARGFEVAIVTGDKDFFQLVHDGLKVYNPKDDGTWYDEAGVKEKFGVTPAQVVDVLALMGDSIDNIKGVPGIGEKGARDLIATYGDLETLLGHAAEVSNKRYREGLQNYADDARQSRELARIRVDVPVDFDPDAVRYRGVDRAACFELFTRLGFRSLVMEYAPTADTVGKDYAIVDTIDALRTLAGELAASRRVALRVIPDEPAAMRAGIVGIAFSSAPHRARYVPFAAGNAAPAGRLRPGPMPRSAGCGARGATSGAAGAGGGGRASRPRGTAPPGRPVRVARAAAPGGRARARRRGLRATARGGQPGSRQQAHRQSAQEGRRRDRRRERCGAGGTG